MTLFLQCIKDYFKNSLYKLGNANGELLQVQQRFVCEIKKPNVIEMTILYSYN